MRIRVAIAVMALLGLVWSPPLGAQTGRPVPEITFVVPGAPYDPVRFESGVLISGNWRRLGLQVNFVPMDFTALSRRIQVPPWDFQAFISGFVARPERLDPDVLLFRPFHSSQNIPGGTNFMGYVNPEYDKLVENQRTEVDVTKRREMVFKLQEILARDVPTITLYHPIEVHAYNKQKFSGHVPMIGYGIYNFWTLTRATPLTGDGILKVGRASDLESTNPFVEAGGANIEVMRLIYDTLARVDSSGKPIPWAAKGWKQVNPTTVEVELRTGMKFHDGQPVTAADVKFSYDFLKRWTVPLFKPFVDPIKEIEAVNPTLLRFKLEEPFPPLFQATFTQIYIIPRHIWGDVVERERLQHPSDWQNPRPIGSGPFRFELWRRGEETRLLRFDEHFSPPKARGFILVRFANQDALFLALKKGDIDMHERRLLPQQVEEAKSVPFLDTVRRPDFGVFYMGFNLRQPPFNDVRFRRAIAYTINYDTIVNVIQRGLATPGRGMIAPINEFWHNTKVQYADFDMEQARTILRQAGYTWDAQGRLLMPAR
jgi:peptide/nickel transport system substrate-binding protein